MKKAGGGSGKPRQTTKTAASGSTAGGGGGPDPAAEQRMLELKEKIHKRVACDERAQKIVQRLLDDPITSQFMVDAGQFIQPSHYKDVVEERAIAKQCGYPVCQNVLGSTPKQKYHISVHHNKVYDITERKNFCSNQCYRASKFFESQISSSPVWARGKEAPVQFTLLPLEGNPNKAIIGEEVMYDPRIGLKQELEDLEELDKKTTLMAQRSKVTGVKTVHDLAKQVSDLGISTDGEEERLLTRHETDKGKESEVRKAESEVVGLQELAAQVRDLMCLEDEEGQGRTEVSTEVRVASGSEQNEAVSARVAIEGERSAERGQTVGPTPPAIYNDLVQQGSQDKDASTSESRSDVTSEVSAGQLEVGMVEKTSVNKSNLLKELNSLGANLEKEEDGTLSEHTSESHGTETVAAVENTTHQKTQLLMELLNRRDRLQDEQATCSGESPASQDLHAASDGDTPAAESRVVEPALQQVARDTEMIHRNIKIKSVSVMENIRRVASQRAAVDADVKRVPKKKDEEKVKSKSKTSVIDVLRDALYDWKTKKCVEFLTSGTFTDEVVDKSEFERKYAALGMRVNALDMSEALGEESTSDPNEARGKLPDMGKLERDTVQLDLRVREYFRGNMRYPLVEDKEEAAEVRGGPQTKEDDGPWESSKPVHVEPILPLVDSHSQVAIRRKIVLDRLSKIMPGLLEPLRLTMHTVGPDLRPLVKTFNFTSTNILFKPAEWRLVAYLLLRMLCLKSAVVRKAMAQDSSVHYFRAMVLSFGLAESQLDAIVRHMTSAT